MTQARSGMRLLLVVGVVYAALTSQRLALYRQGELAVWADAAQQSAAPRPWINLGTAQHLAGDDAAARVSYLTALSHADAKRSIDEWRMGGALAQANLAILNLNDPACALLNPSQVGIVRDDPRLYNPVEVRCNIGRQQIASAHDRWPQSAELTRIYAGTQ